MFCLWPLGKHTEFGVRAVFSHGDCAVKLRPHSADVMN